MKHPDWAAHMYLKAFWVLVHIL